MNPIYMPHYDTAREYESPIHEYRVAMGLTIKELVLQSGVQQATISALANGSLSPLVEKGGSRLRVPDRKSVV